MDWLWAHDYELARQVLQRGVAAIYLVAFISTLNQFPALLGERGLSPAPAFLRRVSFREAPSIFHWHYSDRMLRLVCLVGVLASASVVVGLPQLGPPWVPLLVFLLMWALYLSIVNVGQTFYGFGWESLLLEAGFIVAFLGSNEVPPPLPVIVLCWWLVFRLEFGAGMIKMRGGREWRDLTALMYHHETQPMPGPLSRLAHLVPGWFHRLEVLGSHFAQLIVPWFLFAGLVPHPAGQWVAATAALIVILTQGWLVVTGNFAWLNWLSIVLAFSAVPDLWALGETGDAGPLWFGIVVIAASVLLLVLSWRPLLNLFSRDQLMNASFNRYHLVNAYGAFGTVTKERYEVIVEGTTSRLPSDGWREYEFKGKPGDPTRVPRQFAPYHLRLDWLMWFLALGRQERWFSVLLVRLLEADRAVLRMLRHDPFAGERPTWVRARVFAYRFATRQERRERRLWWERTAVGELSGPVQLGPAHTSRTGSHPSPSGGPASPSPTSPHTSPTSPSRPTSPSSPASPSHHTSPTSPSRLTSPSHLDERLDSGQMTAPRHDHLSEMQSSAEAPAEGGPGTGAPAASGPDTGVTSGGNPEEVNAVDVENDAGEPDPGVGGTGQDGARG